MSSGLFTFRKIFDPKNGSGRAKKEDSSLGKGGGLSAFELNTIKSILVPSYYAKLAGLPSGTTQNDAFKHYIEEGLSADISPSPLFDNSFYREAAAKIWLPEVGQSKLGFLHWLRYGIQARVVPTPRFDEHFYLSMYSDISNAKIFGYLHYLQYGCHEDRQPNVLFEPAFYKSQQVDLAGLPSYLDFLLRDNLDGLFPAAIFRRLLVFPGNEVKLDRKAFDDLAKVTLKWTKILPQHLFHAFISLYIPALNKSKDPLREFIEFLDVKAAAGGSLGPLFEESYYKERLIERGLKLPAKGESPLLHWLNYGFNQKVVPTSQFDEVYYLNTYPDIAAAGIWAFEHFIRHGLFEGRRPNAQPVLVYANPNYSTSMGILPAQFLTWSAGQSEHNDHELPESLAIASYNERMREIFKDGGKLFSSIIRRAQHLEPSIGEVPASAFMPPLHHLAAYQEEDLRRRIPKSRYETIVCVPWLRVGGADLVATILSKALKRIRPDEELLILRCDKSNLERWDWLPNNVDIVDISDVMQSLGRLDAEVILSTIVLGLNPKRLINVNSRICWSMLERFGERLSASIKLYAYLFCWEITPSGLRSGYPSEFFPSTSRFMTRYFTDTVYLKNELVTMYRLPEKASKRITPLLTPSQSSSVTACVAELHSLRSSPRPRHLVLWAGRLDRQKRFDLVLKIAEQMPEVDFQCWGSALLDAPGGYGQLPPNVSLKPFFTNYEELPLVEADAWLYTSEWDGMPTILIELGKRGVTVVASAVGGVPELVNLASGWPVAPFDDVDAYVAALRKVFDQRDETVRRGWALQKYVTERYSEDVYDRDLKSVLEAEINSGRIVDV